MGTVNRQDDEARPLEKVAGRAGLVARKGRFAQGRLDPDRADSEVTTLFTAGDHANRGPAAQGPAARSALAELVGQASILAKAIEHGDAVSRETVSRHSPCDCTNHSNSCQLLLTPEQVAEALAIGRTRVYELMASGALPSIRLGRSRRVARHALSRYVDDLCATGDT